MKEKICCPTLKEFLAEEIACAPCLDAEGNLAGCHETFRDHPIQYCPWCGQKFSDIEKIVEEARNENSTVS